MQKANRLGLAFLPWRSRGMLGGNRSLEKHPKTAIWQRLYNNKKICYRQSYRHPQKFQRQIKKTRHSNRLWDSVYMRHVSLPKQSIRNWRIFHTSHDYSRYSSFTHWSPRVGNASNSTLTPKSENIWFGQSRVWSSLPTLKEVRTCSTSGVEFKNDTHRFASLMALVIDCAEIDKGGTFSVG